MQDILSLSKPTSLVIEDVADLIQQLNSKQSVQRRILVVDVSSVVSIALSSYASFDFSQLSTIDEVQKNQINPMVSGFKSILQAYALQSVAVHEYALRLLHQITNNENLHEMLLLENRCYFHCSDTFQKTRTTAEICYQVALAQHVAVLAAQVKEDGKTVHIIFINPTLFLQEVLAQFVAEARVNDIRFVSICTSAEHLQLLEQTGAIKYFT